MENRLNMKFDKWLLGAVLALLVLGAFVVYTAGSSVAVQKGLPTSYFLVSHLKNMALGLVLLALGFIVDHRIWLKLARPLFIASVILLALVPICGVFSHGARRWLSIGFVQIQPSEIGKLALFLLLSAKLAAAGDDIRTFKVGFIRPMVPVSIMGGLLLLEPNFSMFALIVAITYVLLFVAGTNVKYLAGTVLTVAPLAGILAIIQPYRLARIEAFIHPEEHLQQKGYQLYHFLLGLGNGGLFGTGIGQGTQKLGFIPESYKDGAFAVLGEELGFIGSLIVLFLLGFVIYRGFIIAKGAHTRFAKYLAVALSTSLFFNILIHVCVCTGLMPTTGQPLPFISYGGTSLAVSLLSIGVLLNISRPGSGTGIHEEPVTGYSTKAI